MKQYSYKLTEKINEKLQLLNIEGDNDILKKIPLAICILEDTFEQLKEFIAEYNFKDKLEEIFFFKEIKPKLFCKLIYYRKIYNIEIRRPSNSIIAQKIYLEKEQDHIRYYFDKNIDFIQYYRSDKTILDDYYFLRGKHDLELSLESFYFERDPLFSTNYDFKVAKILANDMLAAYLNAEMIKLNNIFEDEGINTPRTKETWTDTKIALIELLYAIQTAGSINNGNIDIKRLVSYTENVLNIDLGDVYRGYLEIRSRKGSRTAYLDKLIECLNKRMDDIDNR